MASLQQAAVKIPTPRKLRPDDYFVYRGHLYRVTSLPTTVMIERKEQYVGLKVENCETLHEVELEKDFKIDPKEIIRLRST